VSERKYLCDYCWYERFAEFVRLSVEKEGFTVDAVHNAEDAEAAFSAVSYDVILLDLGLPDSDGLELLKSWRDRGDETPVLIVTARDGVDDRVVGLNLGGMIISLSPSPWRNRLLGSEPCCAVRAELWER